MLHGNGDQEQLVSNCYEKIVAVCKMFHDTQLNCEQFSCLYDNDIIKPTEDVFKSWDMLGDEEQTSLQRSFKSEHMSGDTFIQEMQELNDYLIQDGRVMPVLIKGVAGCGKSTLISNWITSIEESLSNSCILYHVADPQSSYSIDPVCVLRRFIVILLDQLPMFYSVKDLHKDFPGLLDRACSKYKNGVIIIIDGIDLITDYHEYFKWLLDPSFIPAPVRVIISVSNDAKQTSWKGWQCLEVRCSIQNTLRVCQYHLEEFEHRLTPKARNFIQEILQKEPAIESLSVHLFRHLVFTLLSWTMSDGESESLIVQLWNAKSISDLYTLILQMLIIRHNKTIVLSALLLLYLSSNGLSLAELQELHDYNQGLLPLLSDLKESEFVRIISGMYKIAHQSSFKAIEKGLQISKNSTDKRVIAHRMRLVELFETKFGLNCTSYRVADELSAQLMQLEDAKKLMTCMSSIFIFVHLYRRGRLSTINDCWTFLGKDLNAVKEIYITALKEIEEKEGFDSQIAMLYDIIGSFYKDLGEYVISQQFFEKSLELKEEHLETDDILLRRSHYLLAKLYTLWKKFPSAEDCLKQALEVKNVSEDAEPTIATILDYYANLCMYQEKIKEADMYRKNAATMKESIFVEHDLLEMKKHMVECNRLVNVIYETRENISLDQIKSWLVDISNVYFNTKQYHEAADVLQQALRYLKNDAESTSNYHYIADIMYMLSFVYTTMGQNDKAEGMLENALNTYFKLNLLEEPMVMAVYNSLVKLYKSQKRMDSLERLQRQHCEAMEKAYGPKNIRVGGVINDLAIHLSKMGKLDEAFKLYERAMRIYVKTVGFQDERVSEVLGNLAQLMYAEKKTQLAAHYYRLSKDRNRNIDQLLNFVPSDVQSR